MTGNDYQKLAARTINKGLTFEELKIHALHGMVGEITVNAKILHDEYMRGYRKGYREGRDVIVGIFDDKMKELKNEIAEEAIR